jgi:integrase
MFWKAFFITQYEGALRTKETRLLKWNDIKLNEDGDISEIHIYATKTNKARDVFVKDATFYLKTHKKQQENMKIKTIYVFPQKKNPNLPTSKTTVSDHFRPLFKKSLGEHKWNYLLRHSRGTELYTLAKQNKIARDTAIGIMGHSKDMSDFYTHLDTKEVKEILKKQLYKLEELPVEKKHELEEKISSQQKQIEELKKDRERQNKLMFMLAKEKLNSLKGKEKKDVEKEINFLFGKSNPKS